jgi:hypothetical protein
MMYRIVDLLSPRACFDILFLEEYALNNVGRGVKLLLDFSALE